MASKSGMIPVGGASAGPNGGQRRRRRRGRSKTLEDGQEEFSSPHPSKPTIILAKSTLSQSQAKAELYGSSPEPATVAPHPAPSEPSKSTPQFKIFTRQNEATPSRPLPVPPTLGGATSYPSPITTATYGSSPLLTGMAEAGQSGAGSGGVQSASQPQVVSQGARPLPPSNSNQPITIEVPVHNRLAAPPEMSQSVRLVDDSFQWCDNVMEMLLDHTDFLVVGFLGPQGSGKSTLASMLAGNKASDPQSSYIFKSQSRELRNQSKHQTMGIDFFVTSERVMILDTQPVLSSSVLDHLLNHEKSLPPDLSTAEVCNEIQSLQLAAFLFTVCHVVVVVQDWFLDMNLIEFVKRAEMLKPPTPTPTPTSTMEGSNAEDTEDFFPSLVFVLNKAKQDDFHLTAVQSMHTAVDRLFKDSKLPCHGSASLSHTKLIPGLNPKNLPLDVNLFLLPKFDRATSNSSPPKDESILLSLLPASYQGHPSNELLVQSFRNQIYGAARGSLTHASLTEKNWFHYATKTWEAVKKSSLMSEFNRLLT